MRDPHRRCVPTTRCMDSKPCPHLLSSLQFTVSSTYADKQQQSALSITGNAGTQYLTIKDSHFEGNKGDLGAAISLFIMNSTKLVGNMFHDNWASNKGGAVYAECVGGGMCYPVLLIGCLAGQDSRCRVTMQSF